MALLVQHYSASGARNAKKTLPKATFFSAEATFIIMEQLFLLYMASNKCYWQLLLYVGQVLLKSGGPTSPTLLGKWGPKCKKNIAKSDFFSAEATFIIMEQLFLLYMASNKCYWQLLLYVGQVLLKSGGPTSPTLLGKWGPKCKKNIAKSDFFFCRSDFPNYGTAVFIVHGQQ